MNNVLGQYLLDDKYCVAEPQRWKAALNELLDASVMPRMLYPPIWSCDPWVGIHKLCSDWYILEVKPASTTFLAASLCQQTLSGLFSLFISTLVSYRKARRSNDIEYQRETLKNSYCIIEAMSYGQLAR